MMLPKHNNHPSDPKPETLPTHTILIHTFNSLSMKSIFELFGFLSMACISAAIIFILMGKKDALGDLAKDNAKAAEYGTLAETPNTPRSVTKGVRDSYASDSGSARRAKGSQEKAPPTMPEAAPEERLRALYNDADFVAGTAKKWKPLVADVADEYNVKPQLLLANAVLQSYLGGYSKAQLQDDAAQHAGDRVLPTATAAKRYKYGWSVQKVAEQHNLSRYFPAEIPTASASSERMVSAYNSSAKGTGTAKQASPKVAATAQSSPVEEGFKAMVAKEYGFSSWNGLSRLADPDMKADAQRRVKSLMMAARIK